MKNDENKLDRELEDDALWDLLGKATPPSVSPFFARNVVREVRQQQKGFARFFSRRWRFIPAAAALGLLCCISINQVMERPHAGTEVRTASVDKIDYEVITNLDDLLASRENSVWLDDSNQ
jgi:hypothetical protein